MGKTDKWYVSVATCRIQNDDINRLETELKEFEDWWDSCTTFDTYMDKVKLSTVVRDVELDTWRSRYDIAKMNIVRQIKDILERIKMARSKCEVLDSLKGRFLCYTDSNLLLHVSKDKKCINIYGTDKARVIVYDETKLQQLSYEYRAVNVLHKPYLVLLYQQIFKNGQYGLKPDYAFKSERDLLSRINTSTSYM